jgi:hypothetical protein
MAPRTRTLLAIVFGLPLLVAVPLALVGARILQAGTLEVHVVEKGPAGDSVDVRVPAAILPAVATVAPMCSLGGCRLDPDARLALRVAADVLDALRAAPDGVLVDVRTRDEVIRIEKRDGKIEVAVDSREEVVHASMPLGAIRSALGFL